MHANQTSPAKPAPKPNLLPGPHHCSAVGNNISTVLRAAMMEMCDRHGDRLTREEIIHTIDVVMSSPELFFLYRQGYSGCVGLKDSPQFMDIDELVITQFVVRTYCQDAVSQICDKQGKAKRASWSAAFVDGFTKFLSDEIDPELPTNLYRVYQVLVTQVGGALTPVTILGSQELVTVFGETVDKMHAGLRQDPTTIIHFEQILNAGIAAASKFGMASSEKLKRATSLGFFSELAKPVTDNPFRKSIVTRARQS